MTTITTAEQAEDIIAALDLREEAIASLGRESVRYHCERAGNSGESIETLIVGDRAGQAQGGDAAWGDWNEKDQTITMDDGECPHECGCLGVTELDGSTACVKAALARDALGPCRSCGSRATRPMAVPLCADCVRGEYEGAR